MEDSKEVKRLYSIDVFRIICALMVFLFHSRIHINVNYGILNTFIGTGHIFMVAFFMLSGFSLFYVDSQRGKFNENSEYKNIGNFLRKRILNLYPLYIFLYLLYILKQFIKVHVLNQTIDGHLGILDNIIASPVELSLLQSVLIGSFSLLHNGGTWFISCIFICYIFYPYIVQIVNSNSCKNNIWLAIFLYCIASYAFLPVYKFHFSSIYANPLLRFVEFSIGIVIGKFFVENCYKEIKKNFWLIVLSCYILLCFVITFGVHYIFGAVEMYNFVAIPCFGCILYLSGRLECKYGINHLKKIISVLSENTYAFFLAQFFAWEPAKCLMTHTTFFDSYGNIKKIVISTVWTCLVTVVLHYCIEKPCKKLTKKFL